LLLAGLLTLAPNAVADDAPRKSVYQRTLHSTALIVAGTSQGTGWVADKDRRLVVTNSHVVGNRDNVIVIFPMFDNGRLVAERSAYRNTSRRVRASVLDVDPRRDLAVLEVESLPADAVALPLAPEPPSPGDLVHSVGNPGSSDALWVYTSGTVRQVYRKKFAIEGQTIDARVVETQAPINPGDSGGPVLNDRGEVVGVTAATNRAAQLVSVCIEVSEVKDFLAKATSQTTPRTAVEFNRRGEQLFGKGRYDKALADFTKAIELDNSYAVAYVNRAICFQTKDDLITALADFDTAIRLKPDYGLAYRGRAFVYWRRNDNDRALADVNEALRLTPADAIGYNLRGVVRYNRRQYDAALTDYAEAIRLDPTYATPHYNRGDLYNLKGEYDKAIASFDNAIRINPNLALAYRGRGLAYRSKNNLTQAQADYDRAVQFNPRDPVTFRDRAVVHKARGAYDLAAADCTVALRLNPKDPVAYNVRGEVLALKNDWNRAIADFSEAIRLNPRFAAALHNRGLAYQATGDKDKAKADLDEAARLEPSLRAAASKPGDRPPDSGPPVKPPDSGPPTVRPRDKPTDRTPPVAPAEKGKSDGPRVRFKAVHGYTSERFQAWIDELIKTDYYPISVSGYAVDGKPRFAAVAVDDGTKPAWQTHFNLDAALYRKKFDEFKAAGYRPAAVVGYQNGDGTSYAGIWVNDGTKRAWHLLRNYTVEDLVPAVDQQKEKGMRPVFLAGYPVGSAPRFAAIFHATKGVAWVSRYDLTGADLQKALDELKPQGYRPACLSGYERGDVPRFACLFVKDAGVARAARYNLTADGLKQEFAKWTPQGYRPLGISGYHAGDELRYAVVWVKD
jgi:tetratricopeptide (TPR) repeat protein